MFIDTFDAFGRAIVATTLPLFLIACTSAEKVASQGVPTSVKVRGAIPIRPTVGGSPQEFARFAELALAEAGVKGWGLAVIRDGRVVVERFGGAASEAREPVTGETLFDAESIAKPVTAWGVLRLVELGKVDLDAPIESYLLHFRLPPSDFDHSQVTVRRVLTHTSGLSWGRFEDFGPDEDLPSLEELLSTEDDLGQRLLVESEPGSGFNYSTGGFALLQLLIQDVSGRSFAEFMQTEILEPLGMERTVFSPNGKLGPTFDGFGEPVPDGRGNDVTASSLRTTLLDLTTFALAHLPAGGAVPGRRVLRATTLEAMASASPEARNRRGLGYSVHVPTDGKSTMGHAGGTSEFRVVPETGEGFVLVSNSLGDLSLPRIFCAWNAWIQGVDDACSVNAAFTLFGAYQRGGVTQVLGDYRALEESGDPGYWVGPGELSTFARMLLDANRIEDATQLYALLSQDDSVRGTYYAEVAEALETGRAPTDATFAGYLGTYEASSGETVTLSRDGDELILVSDGIPWTSSVRIVSAHVSTFRPRGTEGELSGELVFDLSESGQAVRLTIEDPAVTGMSLIAERTIPR